MTDADAPLAEVFQAHRRGLAGAVRAVLGPTADATEVLQDAFVKALRAWQRGERPTDLVGWTFVIVWNTAKDARRTRGRRPTHEPLDEDQMPTTTTASPPEALLRREAVAMAQAAVAELEDREQQVFLLRVSAGLSFEAAAEALQIPVGTAKTRMRAALHKLRRALGGSNSTDTEERQ
ncbi:MAG: hypothetical protein RL398_2959 [Planctomycetota bacterium]